MGIAHVGGVFDDEGMARTCAASILSRHLAADADVVALADGRWRLAAVTAADRVLACVSAMKGHGGLVGATSVQIGVGSTSARERRVFADTRPTMASAGAKPLWEAPAFGSGW